MLEHKTVKKIQAETEKYPEGRQQSAILYALNLVQHDNNGFLTTKMMDEVPAWFHFYTHNIKNFNADSWSSMQNLVYPLSSTSYPIEISAHTFNPVKIVEKQQLTYSASNLLASTSSNFNLSVTLFGFLFPITLLVGSHEVTSLRKFILLKIRGFALPLAKADKQRFSSLNDPLIGQ